MAVSALTTLCTPYLIRGSDSVVAMIGRFLPPGLLEALDSYTRWVGGLSSGQDKRTPAGFLRKWGWQILLNLVLIGGIFIAAAFAKDEVLIWWPSAPGGLNGVKGMLWLTAMICSLPMLIAVVRKWQAFGMLVSEMSVSRAAAGENTTTIRNVVSGVVFVAGSAGLLLYLLLLSSAVLPSRNLLVILVLVLIATAILLRRSFTRLHTKAQIALQATLNEPPAPLPAGEATELPPMLRHAALVMLSIPPESPAAGKVIAELQLRSSTGVSIVGIERENENIINPSAFEEIRAGDSLLLLGNEKQIMAARKVLE